MNSTPIFESSRVHCFYDDTYDLNLLPTGSSTAGLPRSYKYTASIKPGASNLYDTNIKKYDLSVNFAELRQKWVNGVDIPIENITVELKAPAPIDAVTPEPLQFSASTDREINRINDQIRRYQANRVKLVLVNAPPRRLRRLDHRINWAQQELNNLIHRETIRLQRQTTTVQPTTVQPTTVQSTTVQPTTVQLINDEESEDLIADSDEEDTNPPLVLQRSNTSQTNTSQTNTSQNITRESRELSEAREALSAERMGQNRLSVVQQLRTKVNTLENSAARVQLIRAPTRVEAIPTNIINESIDLARPAGNVSEDNIFEHLQLLQWRDKDEFKMAPNNLSRIPLQTLNEMYPIMQQLAVNLRTAIADKTGAVEAMEDADRNNFLFHVMAKGKDIYYQSLCDPDFCLYLLDNWQPLYTFMCKKLNRN